MGRFGRKLLSVFAVALFAFALPALASNVTVNGTANFSSLDGSVDDQDHVVNGIFTVNGDLTVNGTINCNDDGAGANSACAMQFAVSGNVFLNAGSAVFAENRTKAGNGGDITFTVGGDVIIHGPSGSLAGAIVSSAKTNDGNPAHGGDITVDAGGTFTQESGSTVSSAAQNASAGAISITSGGQATLGGYILAGPSRTISTSTIYTGSVMTGGGSQVLGGAITIKALTHNEPGLIVNGPAIIASQSGDVPSDGSVTLEACNVQINGLVASLGRKNPDQRVTVRSGTTITIDGSQLNGTGSLLLGRIRGDSTAEDASTNRVELFAAKDIVIAGPSSASTLFTVTSNPGDKGDAGSINVISLTGTVAASGNAFAATGSGKDQAGGNINVSAKGNVTLNGASIIAAGGTTGSSRAGGHIAARSYSGALNWITGVGDVRPVGTSAGVPVIQQGTISLTACTTVSTSGTSFPTNGPVAGVFPTITTGACSPSAPSLPAGEPALPVCCNAITVINPAVSSGQAGSPFSQTFTQTGAIGTATFSIATGTLPAGLTLATNGVLSGTPTVTGNFLITVMVTDSQGCTGVGPTYPLQITCPTITVTNPAVNSGTAGVAFSQTFTQSGGIGTTTFSLGSGTVPAGLTLASNGVLSGTPTQTGTYPITVTATDSNGCTGTGPTYTLTINCQTITVTNPAVSSGTAGAAFSQTFTQSGAIGTTTFSLASGTLPTGLTLSSAGVLSGMPTQTGSFPVTVKATDSNGCNGTGPTYTLVIACQTITVTNPAVNSGTVGAAFSQTFTQSGGIGATTFSLASGTLPTGLTLSSAGVLSGTPTQTGTFPITVTATDSNGCNGTGTTYTLTIVCQTITVTNPAVLTGTAGTPFSQSFTQSGAIGTATFTTSSSLPAGLTLSAAGVLSGTPTQTGSFPIVVTVTDSNGCTGTGDTYTLVINCQTIIVTNPANNTGTVDAAFSVTFTQSGAIGTATFSLASGTLPSGLTLSTSGVLSGVPQVPGTFSITVKVTDSNGCTGTGPTYTLTISCQTITVTNPSSTTATYNTPLSGSFTFTQSGVGTHTPAVFTLNSGSLPPGVSLSTGGVLSGTPTQTGVFSITVKVTDANGCSSIGTTYTLTVGPKLTTKSYVDVGNTQLDGGLPAPATPAVISVAVSNGDSSDAPIVYAVTVPPSNGVLTIFNANGTFLYTPNVGNITTDSFTYSGTSNGITATRTATINFTGRVWYVDNATGAGTNDGRSNTPFTTMTAVGGASTASGDFIYVSKGSGPTTGSYAMLSSQQLIGAGATLNVGASLLVIPGSDANTPTLSGTLTLANSVTVAGIDMSTGASNAINGSGVTGINVTARNVTTTTGTAVFISGAGNTGTMTLASVSASGGANGIFLQNFTGGGFTVNGDGTDTSVGGNSSGGTIANMAGANGSTGGTAIYLNNVQNVVLRRMRISGTNQNYGIRGFSVNGFTLEYSTVAGINGNAASLPFPENDGEGSIYFGNITTNGLTNLATFTKCQISGGRTRNLSIIDTSGAAAVTIKGCNFGLNQNFIDANQSVAIEARNAGTVLNSTVGGTGAGEANTFAGSPGDLMNVTGQSGTTMDLQFLQNALSNSHAQNVIGGGGMTLATAGTMTFNVDGNSFRDADGSAITLSKGNSGVLLSGKVKNNTIGVSGVVNSGSGTGNGIFGSFSGAGTVALTIADNQIRNYGGNAGLYFDNTGGSYTANFTITGNTTAEPGAGAFAGLALTNGAPSSTDTVNVCATITGNDFSAGDPSDSNDIIVGASGAAAGHTFNLPGYAGGANLANVQTFIQNNNLNPGSTAVFAYTDPPVTPAAFTGSGTSCPTP